MSARLPSRLVAVVADDAVLTRSMARAASQLGHRVLAFTSPAVARDVLSSEIVDVVVAVRRTEPISGCELAEALHRVHGAQRPAFVLALDPTDIFDTGASFDAALWDPTDRTRIGEAIDRACAARSSPSPELDDECVRVALGLPTRPR